MTIEHWFDIATADVKARGLDGAVTVLAALAQAMRVLRSARWNDDATGTGVPTSSMKAEAGFSDAQDTPNDPQ